MQRQPADLQSQINGPEHRKSQVKYVDRRGAGHWETLFIATVLITISSITELTAAASRMRWIASSLLSLWYCSSGEGWERVLAYVAHLFYGCPVGNFRQPGERRIFSVDDGFNLILVARDSADLDNEERSCGIRDTITTNRLRYLREQIQDMGLSGQGGCAYVIAGVERPQDFGMDGLCPQTLLILS
jgi:hypothetical protein